MKRSKTFTGGKQSIGTPTMGKEAYRQLIRLCRDANRQASEKKKEVKE